VLETLSLKKLAPERAYQLEAGGALVIAQR
jgi:hypothetical protein